MQWKNQIRFQFSKKIYFRKKLICKFKRKKLKKMWQFNILKDPQQNLSS